MSRKRRTRAQKERARKRRATRQIHMEVEAGLSDEDHGSPVSSKKPDETPVLAIDSLQFSDPSLKIHRYRLHSIRISLLALVVLVSIQLALWLLERFGLIVFDFIKV